MALIGKKIVVDERPFMVWEIEQPDGNLQFIKSIDPTYFFYMADYNFAVFKDTNEAENHKHAALCIRITYSHALETLFAFLFSAIQAPDSVGGWLKKYKPLDISNLIVKINNGQKILSKIKMNEYSWKEITRIIYDGFVLKDKASSDVYKEQFSILWSRFSNEYRDDSIREEYNSLKHGFRINPGGFGLAIGIQDSPDTLAPPEKMQSVGYSKYGSTYPTEKRIRENEPSFRLVRNSRNWEVENYVHAINLISMSLNNIQSFLKIANGEKPSTCKVNYPGEINYFEEPWKRSSGVNNISFDEVIDNKDIPVYTKEDILNYYNNINT